MKHILSSVVLTGALFCAGTVFASSDCSPYQCNDGTNIARCTPDGIPINYFAAPCLTHGGEKEGNIFSDLPSGHPNENAIYYLRDEGISSGYPDGTYRPDATINRAEFVKILVGAQKPAYFPDRCRTIKSFTDVLLSDWFNDDVCRAKANGYIIGYIDNTFRPAQNINFVEAAKIIMMAFDLPQPFEEESDPWYKFPVMDLQDKNAIPTSITRFDQYITRGEMAEMIYRLKAGITDRSSWTYEELAGGTQEMMSVTLYFGDQEVIAVSDCSATKPVTRYMPKTTSVADSTLRLLFLGVTQAEKAQGLVSIFENSYNRPLAESYWGISVAHGVATVKFTEAAMDYLNSAACMQQAIKASIEQTLLEFPSIQSVQYSVDGKIVTEWDA